jgi:electron transfer flavoprotein beta subunit
MLKSVVCVKQIFDVSYNFIVNQGRINWGDSPEIINPWDEFAVEAALLHKESVGGEIVAVSIGDERAREALKYAISMGCDSSMLIQADESVTIDSLSAALILAAAIQKIGDVDLVFFGIQGADTEAGVLAVQTARKLQWPVLTYISSINEVNKARNTISVLRTMEEGEQSVETNLPAVLSINKDFGEPRYPSFLGSRKASKAVIPVWTLSDLDISPDACIVELGFEDTHRSGGNLEMIQGDSTDEIAQKLVDKLIEAKVL